MIHTILVPLDGSEDSERSLPIAAELAHALAAEILLVCAAREHASPGSQLTEADQRVIAEEYAGVTEEEHRLSTNPRMVEHMQRQVRAVAGAEDYLAQVAGQLAAQGLRAQTAVPYGSAAEGILTEIELHSADLVVMTAHPHGALERLIAGSTTQKVLEESPVPVLITPPLRG